MLTNNHPDIDEVYNVYADSRALLEETQESLDELRSEFEEGLSGFTEALDEVCDQLEQCRRLFRKLNRLAGSGCILAMEKENRSQKIPQNEFLFEFDNHNAEPVLPFC